MSKALADIQNYYYIRLLQRFQFLSSGKTRCDKTAIGKTRPDEEAESLDPCGNGLPLVQYVLYVPYLTME